MPENPVCSIQYVCILGAAHKCVLLPCNMIFLGGLLLPQVRLMVERVAAELAVSQALHHPNIIQVCMTVAYRSV